MLYAVAEIAVFMVGATIVGFLLGRLTKRGGSSRRAATDPTALVEAREAVRELESERAALRSQLSDAKERVRQLAEAPTAAESAAAATHELAAQKRTLERELEEARAQADRLRAAVEERDGRIAGLMAGEVDTAAPPAPIGFSSSAGTLADMRIVFEDEDSNRG
jgi:uncharacterized membrane-anchored protein YhcB (DUF1043 family)